MFPFEDFGKISVVCYVMLFVLHTLLFRGKTIKYRIAPCILFIETYFFLVYSFLLCKLIKGIGKQIIKTYIHSLRNYKNLYYFVYKLLELILIC